MKYLLFVKFDSGLMHNTFHDQLRDVLESVKQLMIDEKLDNEVKELPNICDLKKHLNRNDDYFWQLSNGTWFHIQPQKVFEIVK